MKKYWLEILTIIIISVVLINNCAVDMTWMNTDSDGIHYTYSSQYLYPSHKGSAPLYLLLGNLFLRIPIGTEFWRMAMISVISGIIASLLILLIIKYKTNNKWYACIGALLYGGSALAMSQNIIVESYPLVTALCLGVYYACLKEKWLTASVLIGISGAVHPTSMLVIIPMLIYYRKNLITWRRLAVMASFLIFYIYVPLTNRPPYMWFPSNETGGILGFVKDSIDTATMLTGKLAVYDFPKRLFDAGGVILVSFAIVGIVPLIYAFKKKGWYKDVLLWIILIPALYYLTDLAPQTYVYLQPSIAFGAVAVGIGLQKLGKKRIMQYATATCVLGFLIFNANYFDIGRTLDKDLSAVKYYTEELDKVPDNQILMPYYGWEWAAIYRYNKENDRDIIPVCIDTLSSPNYQDMLTEQGIKFADNHDSDRLVRQNYLALSIVSMNENAWTTRTTDDRTYGCEVIIAKGNEDILVKIPSEPAGRWHWKPNNPYDIITGACEVSSWNFITMSNHNMLMVGILFLLGYLMSMWATRMFGKRKVIEKSDNRSNESTY